MELGEKLRLARQGAGLSQRELCGEKITRNMLSQIENGTAQPSMATLRYLAERLGKPMGYFLEQEALTSPNASLMEEVHRAVQSKNWKLGAQLLEGYQAPDAAYDWEEALLRDLIRLALAEEALEQGRWNYARSLLEAEPTTTCFRDACNRRRLLLLGKIPGEPLQPILYALPSLDAELMLRAEGAMERDQLSRAAALLDAVEHTDNPRWNLLRGQCHLKAGEYESAIVNLLDAQQAYPALAIAGLEQCYRELGNFEQAYLCACKLRAL